MCLESMVIAGPSSTQKLAPESLLVIKMKVKATEEKRHIIYCCFHIPHNMCLVYVDAKCETVTSNIKLAFMCPVLVYFVSHCCILQAYYNTEIC